MPKLPLFDFASQDFKRNPWPVLADLRARGPVVKVRLPFVGQVWFATTGDAVADVLKDTERFVMNPASAGKRFAAGIAWWMPQTIKVLADNMLLKDDPDHRRLRRLVDQAFHRQDVERLRDRMVEIASELLAPFESAKEMDVAADFARAFPLYVIAEILGLPKEDRPQFRQWASNVVTTLNLIGFLRAVPKFKRLQNYLRAEFDACRRAPRPGLISALVEVRDEGEKLTDSELLSMAFLLLMAGHETTSQLISVGMLTLLQHPDQKRTLMSDWSGVGLATEELLRYAAPVPFSKPRHVRNDMDFHGQRLKRGEYVMAVLAAANIDPAHTDRAGVLDLKRRPNPHYSFGTGQHYCLGLQLARAEAQVAYRQLLTRFPDMRLAIPEADLKWGGGGIRGLVALPVRLRN